MTQPRRFFSLADDEGNVWPIAEPDCTCGRAKPEHVHADTCPLVPVECPRCEGSGSEEAGYEASTNSYLDRPCSLCGERGVVRAYVVAALRDA